MPRNRREYSPEFKAEAVRRVVEGGVPLAAVARELGVSPNLLSVWRRTLSTREADVVPESEELRRLRRENEVLRQERDFLKKATAFFAKESR